MNSAVVDVVVAVVVVAVDGKVGEPLVGVEWKKTMTSLSVVSGTAQVKVDAAAVQGLGSGPGQSPRRHRRHRHHHRHHSHAALASFHGSLGSTTKVVCVVVLVVHAVVFVVAVVAVVQHVFESGRNRHANVVVVVV